jgi:hypothetical protein
MRQKSCRMAKTRLSGLQILLTGKRSACGRSEPPQNPTVKRARILKKGFINAEKQKPSHRLGSLNSGAGLGIEHVYNLYFIE